MRLGGLSRMGSNGGTVEAHETFFGRFGQPRRCLRWRKKGDSDAMDAWAA
jgi:hypothetical protein